MYIVYKLYAKSDLSKTPKYIGITATSLNLRLQRHIARAKKDYGKLNWPVINWINSVLTDKDQIIIEPIDFAQSQKEAFEKEIFYIDFFKKQNIELKNSTLGGDGTKKFKIKQFSKEGTLIKLWDCIANIEQELGLSNSHISSCCNNKRGRKTVGGFIWRHEKDDFNTFDRTRYINLYAKSIQKKIYQIDEAGNVVKIWNHSQEIENETGFTRSYIAKISKNPITSHKQRPRQPKKSFGYYWANESNKDIVRSLLKSRNTVQVDI